MVLIFSSNANASNQIQREIERVVAKGVPIVPVRIEEVAPTQSMEYFLGGIHWLDALSQPLEEHLHKLTETVRAILQVEVGAHATPIDGRRSLATGAGMSAETGGVGRSGAMPSTPPDSGAAIPKRPARPGWLLPILGAVATVALIVGGIWLYARLAPPSPPAAATTLRAAAQARDFLIGAAVYPKWLREEPIYSETIAREYNILTPETPVRFRQLRPSREQFDFADADMLVDFAIANRMKVRGESLIWGGQLSQWLTDGKFSPADISAILKEHVQTVVRRYRGRWYAWDVINGVLDENGKMYQNFWWKALGDSYVEQAFIWAREADPQVKLFMHDYSQEPLGKKSDGLHDLIRALKLRGIPIDGIGMNFSWLLTQPPRMQDVAANMKRLAALGLEIHITEFEVSIPLPATEQNLQKQADLYRENLAVCLTIAACKSFTTWGFSDKHAYAPSRWPGRGAGAAMPLDAAYRPKPAYRSMLDALNAR
jgi:endo-1,4-beta-xylanase